MAMTSADAFGKRKRKTKEETAKEEVPKQEEKPKRRRGRPKKTRVAKPVPKVGFPDPVLGTDVVTPAAVQLSGYAKPMHAVEGGQISKACADVGQDVWNMYNRRPIRLGKAGDDGAIIALDEGVGEWLNGKGGYFDRLKTYGGHPFGLLLLVLPHGQEPYFQMREPYDHDGKRVVGEMWIVVQQEEGGQWSAERFGNGRYKAERWAV